MIIIDSLTRLLNFSCHMTMKERLLAGLMYSGFGPELVKEHKICSLEFIPKLNVVL